MANKKGKNTAADLAETLIAGIQKHLANAQLAFAGGTFTAAQVISELQELVGRRPRQRSRPKWPRRLHFARS
jgi:hypothetical protein